MKLVIVLALASSWTFGSRLNWNAYSTKIAELTTFCLAEITDMI
jgi:hypothetical protein